MKLKNSKSAQTSIEFMILVAFVLFFFTLFFLVIQGDMSDKIREKQNLRIKQIALEVQDEINLALIASDGYHREFKVPEKAGSQDYEISITEEMVYVRTSNNKHAIALPVAKVTGEIIKGLNKISKENNEIYLN